MAQTSRGLPGKVQILPISRELLKVNSFSVLMRGTAMLTGWHQVLSCCTDVLIWNYNNKSRSSWYFWQKSEILTSEYNWNTVFIWSEDRSFSNLLVLNHSFLEGWVILLNQSAHIQISCFLPSVFSSVWYSSRKNLDHESRSEPDALHVFPTPVALPGPALQSVPCNHRVGLCWSKTKQA